MRWVWITAMIAGALCLAASEAWADAMTFTFRTDGGSTNAICGDTLTVATTPVVDPTSGTVSLASDGTFTYTPDADFHGTDTFVYQISDGAETDTRTPAGSGRQ